MAWPAWPAAPRQHWRRRTKWRGCRTSPAPWTAEQVALQKMRCHWCQKCKSLCLAEIWYMVILIYRYMYIHVYIYIFITILWIPKILTSEWNTDHPMEPPVSRVNSQLICHGGNTRKKHPYVDHSVGMEYLWISAPYQSYVFYIYNCIINVYNMIIVIW